MKNSCQHLPLASLMNPPRRHSKRDPHSTHHFQGTSACKCKQLQASPLPRREDSPSEIQNMLVVSPTESPTGIKRWWENSSGETILHTLLCANPLLASPIECPHQHHEETSSMICTFTGLVLQMQSPKALLILLTRILHPQSRKMLATSPLNPSISQIRKQHHAMHLQL